MSEAPREGGDAVTGDSDYPSAADRDHRRRADGPETDRAER